MNGSCRHGHLYTRACASAVLLFCLGRGLVCAQGVGAQIIAALEHYRVAVVQMDYEDEIASFTDDAELSQGNEAPVRGRAQIRVLIQSQAAFKTVGYELHPAATRVQGTVAIQNGFYTQRIISPQHDAMLSKGVFEVQWTRQTDGMWLINRLHTDPVEEQSRKP